MLDRCTGLASWGAALAVAAAMGWLLADVLVQGASAVSWSFLTEAPRDAGRAGGIGPVIVSTLWLLAIALAAAWPLAILTSLWLSELARRHRRLGGGIETSLILLAGMPSIVFGLFGNAFFSVTLGLGFSLLSGGLTLACMILPILVRMMTSALEAVPARYRLDAAALGLSRITLMRAVLIPAALPGLLAGTVLGLARAAAETAALLFTSGYVDRFPDSWLDSGRAISVHVYELAMNVPGGGRNAYGAALVLVVVLLTINLAIAGVVNRHVRQREEAT